MADAVKPDLISTLDALWDAAKAVEAADDTMQLKAPFVKTLLVFKAGLYSERARVRKITPVVKK